MCSFINSKMHISRKNKKPKDSLSFPSPFMDVIKENVGGVGKIDVGI